MTEPPPTTEPMAEDLDELDLRERITLLEHRADQTSQALALLLLSALITSAIILTLLRSRT